VINRAIVRDGKPCPPRGIEDIEILPGVGESLDRLKAAGYLLVVVTNQPDVARGTQSHAIVDAMHAHLALELPIDDFRTCYHDDPDACGCRKPEPGLIIDSAHEHDVDLHASVMVGDRWRDIEAGRRAGCATVFVDYGYAERQPEQPDAVVTSLQEAADWILSRPETTRS
jgi:D-glycero-D-manno-heptose 1,7-bisphosphate phosphatase